ncbi:hypothetical protein CBR_g28033 [Chara braunii]|uniref:RNA-directed DNA polymerase n=1 Tax=Chara braunii TaxID=69332 RepID=A0A388L913_CHABU|nr:hypothetical protein CBR_g28033 [Chara braunii]|eukprot:GBG78809.1 hypothetical protein CBR_g28033 [Chara braunii]
MAAGLSKWEEEQAARQQEIQHQLAEAEAGRQQATAEAAAAARLQQQKVEASQNQPSLGSAGKATRGVDQPRGRVPRRHQQVCWSVNNQQSTADVPKEWKMPNFKIERFDDYHNTDPLQWWMAFKAEANVHHTPALRRLDARYLELIGGAQAFITHMVVTLEFTIPTLHTKITWEEFEKKWKTRFVVNNDKRHALNKIFCMFQGQQPSREWLTEWQRLVATPELSLPFDAVRAEFFARSCDALTVALGSEFHYETFDDIFSKARELIQGDRRAANEARQQPGYVEKGKGQRTPQVAAVQQGPSEDHAAASTSSDGDVAARLPRQGQGKCQTSGLGKLSSAGSAATTLSSPPDSAALAAVSLTPGDTAIVASSRIHYENYVVELVPQLNQPLRLQASSACAEVPPSDNEPVASPALLSEDPSTWASLEELDPLTVEDFQLLPLPSTGSLPTLHCNALMARLREYLHVALPPPSTDDGVAVVDLRSYLGKIDREYATQRYVDIDAPLLYIGIQIEKATCSALIDCGATRNYISQDFMARVGLGPRVRRKSQPTHVTLADGHTQKSIDRCVDSVPVYFAPLACEAVSFDILDTKFDMILGMSWLQSEDHLVNFYRRTVHVRDRQGELVPCTVSLPHPSIGCHVVSVASIRQSIWRNDIEEMGICFLHALPPGDQPKTNMSDPRIIELFDNYEDVFQAPAGVVLDRPIRHGITLEDGVVPPRKCIYRMIEKELQVLRAQLDNLLAKGWIRPSCSPYGAPVLFVRKKNKDLRLCMNYRNLNAQTIKNAGPLPRIDDLLERLGGAKYFSKLDLKFGYHQIEIQPKDRYKTAFKTRYGHFEWIVMAFGLTNAPTTFQAAMTTKFRDLLDRTVLIYLDDILVYSQTLDEHLEHLCAVLERLRIAKYKANHDKCEFAQQESEYLGHYFTPQGIRPLADKVQAIQDWPELKLTTDASGYGIGAVLEQHDDTDWHPVEYFSRKVPPINTLDDARKKELLAFVTVLKCWRHFLPGRRRFTWATDNNPLTYYKTQETVSSTIGRWMYFIDQFDFTSKHIPGSSNKAADAFSRRPDLCALVHSTFGLDENLQQHFVNGYKLDPGFSTLYADLSSDHVPASNYRIVDGYLLLHTRGKDLLCVPQDHILRTHLLGEYHDSRLAGHLVVARTLARLRQRFHWSDIISDINRYIQTCAVCHRNKGRHQLSYGELKPLSIPREPGLSIAMDVTGLFPRDRLGHDGILTVVDRLSKYARFLPCKYHATAPELARLLHTGWFCSHGVPEDIVSDRDTRFMSAFWTTLVVNPAPA